ncbi:VPLPA-CTERM sorting domain-containing protein [Jannaschia seosinensis]|uniref:VPLPA-CTERM sorting domain-containing protein n=1 Tax=Jannaschia seosinensis TaxID=313367 RepID=UPI001FE09B71|nr:VPLPA-CTERM sorting domain-containing protein [Jannaschia seosinensis]
MSALAGVFLAGAASAATVDYTNSQTNPGGPALSCQVGSVNGIWDFLGTSCSVAYGNAGLGVTATFDPRPTQIDGTLLGRAERLILDFGRDTVWNSITFGLWDRNDDVQLSFADGPSFIYGPGTSDNTISLGGIVSRALSITAFGEFPQDGILIGNDEFTVASIDVAPVPLPAAGWMLIAGLGGIATMRRRKRQA